MNLEFIRENRGALKFLAQCLLVIALILLLYSAVFGHPTSRDSEPQKRANSTKTALAMTAKALLGPFPTSTAPTATASDTPTLTPRIPTATPTVTRTPSKTPTPVQSRTPRTGQPNSTISGTPIPVQSTARPGSTEISGNPANPPATDPPVAQPANTEPPPPVEILPHLPPIIQTLLP